MEEVMRFMVLRPPSLAPEDAAIPVRASADLLEALRGAAKKASPGHQLALVAEQHRAKIDATNDIPLAGTLAAWGKTVLDAESDDSDSALASAVAAFGKPAAEVIAAREFRPTMQALADLVAANKFRGFAERDAELAQRAYRAAVLLIALVNAPVASPAAMMKKPMVLDLGPKRRTPGRVSAVDEVVSELPALTAAIETHRDAIAELTTLPARLLAPAESANATRPRGALTSRALVQSLRPATQALLQSRGVRLDEEPLRATHDELVTSLRALYTKREALMDQTLPASYAVTLGTGVYEVTGQGFAHLAVAETPMTSVPTSHSTMSAVGYADLMVVRQQLIGYEGADLSFVENVLIGEHKSREYRTELVTERTDTNETETTKETERDLQSTNRNEMQREAASTMQDQLSMQFGTSISGSYGPTVQFAVNADLGFDHSKEESHKFATAVAQETIQRTATKITERTKNTTTIRVTNTTEEDNIHELDNRTRDEHVVGQYQWLDKIYEAQVFNYGNRLLYDFIVPEPSAQLVKFAAAPEVGSSIKKPPAFTTRADQIDAANYTLLALKYGAEGLEAPPEPTVTVSKVLEGMDENDTRGVTHQVADLPIPEGYAAVSAAVATDFWQKNIEEKPAQVVVLVGGNVVGLNDGKRSDSIVLSGEQGTFPVAMHTFHTPSVVVTVTITCQATARAYEAWRLDTYSALSQAASAALRDYEDKVARAKADAREAAASAPPARRTEGEIRKELKRLAISMFTQQSFETFDAVHEVGDFVKVAFAAAELAGPYIRFFEQAFEWEQMTYVFYPYYWGRPSQWKTRALSSDADPMYLDFLRAGAARLIVPTRKNFEQAVLHFLESGQVWSGGPPPDVTSPEYVSIVTEIKEATGAPGDEVPVGEPWQVRLPTTLVKLRSSDSLPTWSKGEDGRYHPDEE